MIRDPHCRVKSVTVRRADKVPGHSFEKRQIGRRETLVYRWKHATETHVTAELIEVRKDAPVTVHG